MKNSRLISFVLSCAMVFALVVPALATDIETGTTVRGNSLLHALDTKNQEFTILEESTPALSGLPVSYQYTIERTTGEPETVQVTLNLSIQGNNKTYQAVVTGTPKVHTININNSEFEYISGPLRGNINMDGEIYNIIVGFQKHSESEDIQGDVTIQDANYEFEPMFFTFGNVTVDNELLEAIRGLNDQKMEPWDGVAETAQPEGQERSNPNYYAKGPSSTRTLSSHSDVSAVTVVVHYNEYQNRVMGSAIPHVAALEDKFVKTPFESVGIDTLSIEMEESSNTDGDFEGVCYIPSGATGKFSVSDTTSFFTSVLDIAADVPWFGLGASAVSAICEIVNDNKTRCTVVDNMNIVSASYDFKELKGTDMDKCGISIIAGMGPFREGMNNPIARFNARANASYILRMRAPTSGFDVLEYYDANQASVACAMTLT
jgi:hypothetical protein